MKRNAILVAGLLLAVPSFGQVLLEDKDGDRIADNLPNSIASPPTASAPAPSGAAGAVAGTATGAAAGAAAAAAAGIGASPAAVSAAGAAAAAAIGAGSTPDAAAAAGDAAAAAITAGAPPAAAVAAGAAAAKAFAAAKAAGVAPALVAASGKAAGAAAAAAAQLGAAPAAVAAAGAAAGAARAAGVAAAPAAAAGAAAAAAVPAGTPNPVIVALTPAAAAGAVAGTTAGAAAGAPNGSPIGAAAGAAAGAIAGAAAGAAAGAVAVTPSTAPPLSHYSSPLIKLNTGEQSLGFEYIHSSRSRDPEKYLIKTIGIKAKPTEGVASVFSKGQFSPGIKATASLTKVRLLAQDINPAKNGYVDWGSITFEYEVNKYNLYTPDNSFEKQLYTETYKGGSLLFSYNALINNTIIASLRFGYARRTNHDNLPTVTINDVTTVTDPVTNTQRQIVRNKTAKAGTFEEFDAIPLTISFTRATQTDPAGSDDAKALRIGYTVYLKNLVAKGYLPKTNPGVLVFLTKQDKNGVRAPVLGLNVQLDDPFDIRDQNSAMPERVTIGITSIFTL